MAQRDEFIYQQIYSELKAGILSGKYAVNSLLPSERLLCEQYGVWRTTVRQALDLLQSEGLVEKRNGIGTCVIRSEAAAVQPVQKDSKKIIAFFVTDEASGDKRVTQPYYFDLMTSLDRMCQQKGYLLLYSAVHSVTDMMNLIRSNQISFAVFHSHRNFACIDAANEYGISCVLIHEAYSDYMSISCDHSMGGYLAMKHLIENGHRKIGIIAGDRTYMSTQDKIAGCRRACCQFNIPFPSGNRFQYGNWEYEGGYAGAKKILDIDKADRPTALFAFNDSMCIGAIHAIRDLGLRVPEDISIIGSDNMNQLMFTEPNLTTIDGQIDKTAAAIMLCAEYDLPNQLGKGSKILTPVSMVSRGTVLTIPTE